MSGHCNSRFLILLLCSLILDSARGQTDCYRIDGGVIAGIVVGDVIITIMIAMAIYFFARRVKSTNTGAETQMPRKKVKLDTESPYEELQLSQRGLYSELNPSHK